MEEAVVATQVWVTHLARSLGTFCITSTTPDQLATCTQTIEVMEPHRSDLQVLQKTKQPMWKVLKELRMRAHSFAD